MAFAYIVLDDFVPSIGHLPGFLLSQAHYYEVQKF